MSSIEKNMVLDDERWYQAWLDTPLGGPHCATKEQAARTPGCAVKSRERVTVGDYRGMPKHHGKLVVYGEDVVIVRGHGSPVSPKFIWTGTRAEYVSLWECD